MANTYTQLYIHLVFAVKNRNGLIKKAWKDDLEKYITGIVQNHKHKLLAIGTMPDHIHIFSDLHPSIYLSDYVKNIKIASNLWMKESGKFPSFTGWQDARLNDKVGQGYGRLPILTRKKI